MTPRMKASEVRTGSVRDESGTTATNRPKGRETVETILSAAESVLISVGYAQFTARKVADAAGIALGNLTYHFPTMDDLARELVEYVLSRYLGRWQAFRESNLKPDATPASLGEIMRWLITDAVETRTAKLFRELWALAAHSGFAAEAMDNFYRQAANAAAEVARLMFPGLSQSEALNLAYFMAVLSEGSIVLFGTLPEAPQHVPVIQQLATRALECLTATAGSTPSKSLPIPPPSAKNTRNAPNAHAQRKRV